MATYNNIKKLKIGNDVFNLYDSGNSGGTITSIKTTAGAHTTVNVTSGAASFNIPTTAAHVGIKFGYTTSGNNRAVQQDSSGNLYVTQKDDNTTYSVVVAGTSTTDGGLMSRADKTKLNGIATGADKTTVTQTITSGIQIGRVNGTPLYAPPKVGSFKGAKMLLMGNSYMRGVGGTVGRGWGYYFTDLTGCDSTIIQQSGGDFVATGNANADYPSKNYIQVIDTFAPTLTEAERASYQYIVVGGGYNDHEQTPSTVAANIETFVTKCRTYFPNAVIWIIPLWCDRAMETAVEYSNFATWSTEAAINGCGSCSLTFSWFYGQSAYGAGDDIHLNDAGYQRCAKFIHAVLLGWDGNYIPVVGTGWTIGTNVTADSTAGFRYYRDGKYVFIRGALAYTNSVATTKLGTISDMKYRARTAIYFPVFLYTSGTSTRYSAIACIQADGILRLIPQMHALPASGTVYFDHMYMYGV